MEFLCFGGHFHWNLILEKAFLHEPDGYGEQPSLQVNFLVLKDHESSGVDDSLRLGTKNNHRQAFEWAVEQVRQEYYPRGSLTRFEKNFAAVFPHPNDRRWVSGHD